MYLIDSHCHLHNLNYQSLHKDVDEVLKKAASRSVRFFLSVSTTLLDYRTMRELVGNRKNVVFSCGVHPLYQNEIYDIDDLRHLAEEKDVVAIGETGLDYHASNTFLQQKMSFRNHICIGRELNKPVIVHTRNARTDTLSILKEEKAIDCGGVLHCFTEDKKMAGKFLDLGFYISFSGIITFRNTKELSEVVRYVPIDRILIETDSPYLTPIPHRGKENQPAMVRDIAEYVALLKGISIDELAHATTKNFSNLFHVFPEELDSI